MLFRRLPCNSQLKHRSFSSTRPCPQINAFARRLFNLPTAPPAPSQNHHDLPSFLSYAQHSALPETSTTFIGTHYEYTVLQSLRRFAFDLHRVGGRDDAGTDLVGTWHVLPSKQTGSATATVTGSLPVPIRVVVQCKALRTKLGPNMVRELEGAFQHSPVGWRTTDKLAILVSPREATKGVRDTLTRSIYPLFWIMMERDGVIRQVLWNSKVEDMGFASLGVDLRYHHHHHHHHHRSSQLSPAASEGLSTRSEAVLTWDGTDMADMDYIEREMAVKEAEWLALWGLENLSNAEKFTLLDTVEAVFPEIGPGAALNYDKEAISAKKDEVLALLREKIGR